MSFIEGVELANAFYELNDPFEQRARLEGNKTKRENEKQVPSLDEEFLNALESSMPPDIWNRNGTGASFYGVFGS